MGEKTELAGPKAGETVLVRRWAQAGAIPTRPTGTDRISFAFPKALQSHKRREPRDIKQVSRFVWTTPRTAAVKKIAASGGTARDACEAVGLDPEREHLVYQLARREGFRFKNIGRRRDDRAIFLRLDQVPSDLLTGRARRAGVGRRELAAKLLSVVLAQGDVFRDNLLDDG